MNLFYNTNAVHIDNLSMSLYRVETIRCSLIQVAGLSFIFSSYPGQHKYKNQWPCHTVRGHEGLSPEKQIQFVLEAGHGTTIQNGLDMSMAVPEAEVPKADIIQEFGAADDNYD
ncbi:hypothetical protein N9W89_05855 [Hellea sp.]|nr:hypothetical protein [Hellea sp.]